MIQPGPREAPTYFKLRFLNPNLCGPVNLIRPEGERYPLGHVPILSLTSARQAASPAVSWDLSSAGFSIASPSGKPTNTTPQATVMKTNPPTKAATDFSHVTAGFTREDPQRCDNHGRDRDSGCDLGARRGEARLELREGGVEVSSRDEFAGGVRAGLARNVDHGHGERLAGAGIGQRLHGHVRVEGHDQQRTTGRRGARTRPATLSSGT